MHSLKGYELRKGICAFFFGVCAVWMLQAPDGLQLHVPERDLLDQAPGLRRRRQRLIHGPRLRLVVERPVGALLRLPVLQGCKAGVLGNFKKRWKKIALLNAAFVPLLAVVYGLGCCALRNNRRHNYSRLGNEEQAEFCMSRCGVSEIRIPAECKELYEFSIALPSCFSGLQFHTYKH